MVHVCVALCADKEYRTLEEEELGEGDNSEEHMHKDGCGASTECVAVAAA